MEFKWPGEALVEKLWETIAEKGIGGLLKPWQIVREGRAIVEVRKYEKLLLAQAEADANEIAKGAKFLDKNGTLRVLIKDEEVEKRIEPTINLKSLSESSARLKIASSAKSEINASKAILYAEESLLNDTSEPPTKRIDPDWLDAWREYVGKISNEDIQKMWGQALAGELKSPGCFSMRTLDFLRWISQEDALVISRVASFNIEGRLIKLKNHSFNDFGLRFNDILIMQELGLLQGGETDSIQTTFVSTSTNEYINPMKSNDKVILVTGEDPKKTFGLTVSVFTKLGREVLKLGKFPHNIEYLTAVAQEIASKDYNVEIGDWEQLNENQGRATNLVSVPAPASTIKPT